MKFSLSYHSQIWIQARQFLTKLLFKLPLAYSQ